MGGATRPVLFLNAGMIEEIAKAGVARTARNPGEATGIATLTVLTKPAGGMAVTVSQFLLLKTSLYPAVTTLTIPHVNVTKLF